jgi:hypothetical protein
MEKKEMKKFDINNRIMINTVSFKEKNLNYVFLYLDEKSFKDDIEFFLPNNLNSENSSSEND